MLRLHTQGPAPHPRPEFISSAMSHSLPSGHPSLASGMCGLGSLGSNCCQSRNLGLSDGNINRNKYSSEIPEIHGPEMFITESNKDATCVSEAYQKQAESPDESHAGVGGRSNVQNVHNVHSVHNVHNAKFTHTHTIILMNDHIITRVHIIRLLRLLLIHGVGVQYT